MPALVKRRVGSSWGTSGELCTTRWPCRSKYARKERRISCEVIPLLSPTPQQGPHTVRVEPLRDEIAEQTPHPAVVGDDGATGQPLVEDGAEQGVHVLGAKRLVHRRARDIARDAGGLDRPKHARRTMAVDPQRRAGDGAGG